MPTTEPSTTPFAPSRPLGSTGLLVSPLCLGGNVFGWTADRDQSFEVLDAYVAAGGNFIDTSDVYSEWVPGNTGGDSERILGEWLTARGNRADMIIATKVAKFSQFRGLAPENIRAAADASLERLQTDYIDLYYAHEDDPAVPMADSLAAFDALVKSGKARHIAASNFTPERLTEALATSAENGLAGYVAVQNHYNLMERHAYEDATEAIVVEHGLVLTAVLLACPRIPHRQVPTGHHRRQPARQGGRGLHRRARRSRSHRPRGDRRAS